MTACYRLEGVVRRVLKEMSFLSGKIRQGEASIDAMGNARCGLEGMDMMGTSLAS